jgi:hypothetical protein
MEFAGQIRELFKGIAVSEGCADRLMGQIEQWAEAEGRDSAAFAQKLEFRTKEVEERLDKLVNGYLDGIIEKDAYLKRKDELMKIKVDLHHQTRGSGRKPSWLEPLKDWVKTVHHAGKLAFSEPDLYEIRSLVEKIGTKRLVRDKKIFFDFAPPFDILAKNKALQAKSPALAGPVGQESESEFLSVCTRRESNSQPSDP